MFIDADAKLIEGAANIGADRIEYYTGPYAKNFVTIRQMQLKEIKETCSFAQQLGLGINART